MSDTPYDTLTPDVALDAMDAVGFRTDGAFVALNSYENRVYQVGILDGEPVIAKFYRPKRWSDAAILEEHAFIHELREAELPCPAPIERDGTTLFHHADFRYAVFPREAGRTPNVEDPAVLRILGHALGRMHAAGAAQPFRHRQRMSAQLFGVASAEFLLASPFIADELQDAYRAVATQLIERITPVFETLPQAIRIHGDCHLGNLLWRYDAPNFVDFDDAMTGPPIQDLWMLLAGERDERSRQLDTLVTAYEDFHDFDVRQTRLVEPLRTLRIMHQAAWIGRRWQDPAFPAAFPDFAETRYWSNHILALKEQLSALDEPPLTL